MPYKVIEDLYGALTVREQKEVYDFLCFLVSRRNNPLHSPAQVGQYSKGFFSIFGSLDDPSFEEPQDEELYEREDELF